MLELHHPLPMPHATSVDNHHHHLPSLSTMGSWSLPQLAQFPREPIRQSWAKESHQEPLTPPTTTEMGHHAIIEAPSYMRGSRLNPSYNGYHSSLSIPPTQSIPRIESPKCQRRPSNGYEAESPQRSTTITPAMSIPNTVRSPQKDISALAAETTCLFWFETGHTLSLIEKRNSLTASSPLQISPNVIPTPEFRVWVADLLSTTQVAPQVVLLGLLFIHRLKMRNPTVQGQLGSEYRLLTVALMLGNKFLDDNTYTNKTWAEVSHIKLQEVHLMEMEFLSNMRYNLFTTEAEWKEWHVKLGRFGTCVNNYIESRELALKLRMAASLRTTVSQPSPVLPMPPLSAIQFPNHQYINHLSRTITPVLLPQISSNAISPIGLLPEPDVRSGLKRVRDDSPGERPAKRRVPEFSPPRNVVPSTSQGSAMTSGSSSRVSLPNLVIPPFSTFNNSAPITPTSLPLPGTHAMALVYPNSQPGPQNDYHMNVTPIQTNAPMDHIRQLSPYPPSSGHSSPVGSYPNNNYSPSYYLARRHSPYRPVRGVEHLLTNQGTPPAFHAPRRVGTDQMQYHSLGQPLTERHVGHLPYIQQHQHYHQPWSQSLPQPAWTVQS